ncbi:hypothetical protein H5410_031256 [Solanum commersonii]|uniref:Uncharacterized protein n=1 Tax=Solanum commersonii TaxID=4109 RepID=A0A9J5YLR6_SOLCO|nr:hypothetical protein H5410_031256 [Solanum commersonii]
MISSGSAKFQHFSGMGHNPYEKSYHFSKIIIKQIISVEDWDPKTKQLIGQELLDSISKRINEYNTIPQKGVVNDTSVRHIARRISFQEGDKEKMIQNYLEEIDKSDIFMRSETTVHTAGESQQVETDKMLTAIELQHAEDFLQQIKTMDQRHGKDT